MKLKNVMVGVIKAADKVKIPQVMKDLGSIVTTGVMIQVKKTKKVAVAAVKAAKEEFK